MSRLQSTSFLSSDDLAFARGNMTPHARGRASLVVVSLLAGGIAVLHLCSLMRYPPPFVDEAWAANRSWALITEGIAFGGLDAGVFQRYPGYWTYFPMLPTFIQAVPLWLVGHPALWPLRGLSLLFGGLLLASSYSIGRSAHSHALGVVAAALISLSPAFLYSAHLARWDILVASLGYTALALQLGNSDKRLWRALLAGVLVGLAFEIHPHASIFVPVAFGLYAYESGIATFRRRDVWAWAGGLALGALVYAGLHVVRYPSSFIALARLGHGPTHTPPILTLDPLIVIQSVVDTARLLFLANVFWGVAFVFAAVWLLAHREPAGKIPGLLALLLLTSFSLLVRNKIGYYVIYATPAFAFVLAVFAVSVANGRRRVFPNPLAGSLVGIALIIGIASSLSVLRINGAADLRYVLGRIAPHVGSHDVLMGSQTYWFGLTDRRYYSWEQLIYYRRHFPGSDLQDALAEFKPTVLILDAHMEQFVSDTSGTGPYAGRLAVPRSELFAFLERHAAVVADFDGRVYGRVRLFRISWEPSFAAQREGEGSMAAQASSR